MRALAVATFIQISEMLTKSQDVTHSAKMGSQRSIIGFFGGMLRALAFWTRFSCRTLA
jgi:hypothetical protein